MLKRAQVFNLLKENGLHKNSCDWRDYERGKALFSDGFYLEENDYKHLIHWLVEYFNV